MKNKTQICIIGLGYVGLPLAVAFSKVLNVIGYDKSTSRVNNLQKYIDETHEVSKRDLIESKNLTFTSDLSKIKCCDIYIICVPTPINDSKTPDLGPLKSASRMVGLKIQKGNIVIYESTVYPGCTEQECVPILEEVSGLKYNQDFFCGYSPERINPGDSNRKIEDIIKVTSGSNVDTANRVDDIYSLIIKAGTYKAPSIQVAEAAKVIENIQRDVNIALINELSLLFDKLNLDTKSILDAASTKWNFLDFRPGLVGGHCIGVDPYYLEYRARKVGFHTQLISASRRINDSMAEYVSFKLIKRLLKFSVDLKSSKILIMGISFKENCPDIRNSKIFDVIKILDKFVGQIDIYDPFVNKKELKIKKGFDVTKNFISIEKKILTMDYKYDAIIVAVKHSCFKDIKIKRLRSICNPKGQIFDLKGTYTSKEVDIEI